MGVKSEQFRKVMSDKNNRQLFEPLGVCLMAGVVGVVGISMIAPMVETLRYQPIQTLSSTLEEWAVANPASSLPETEEFMSLASYKYTVARDVNLEIPALPDSDDTFIRVSNKEGSEEFLLCTYEISQKDKVYSFNSSTGETNDKGKETCS